MKRQFAKVIPAVAASTCVAALAASSIQALAASKGASAHKPVTLTWFMWTGSEAEVKAWEYDASLVTKKYPWIHIKFETASWPNYWTKLEAEAASNTLPDIVSLQSLRTAGFASSFRPLTPYVKSTHFDIWNFDPGIIRGLTYQGHLLALPYDYGPLVIFYNKALFAKYHVPYPTLNWTWADFLRDAKALTRDGNYGFAASPYPDAWLPFALSAGGHYLTPRDTLNLTDPKLIGGLNKYAELVYKYHVAPKVSAAAVTNVSLAQQEWASGNIGMVVDGPWDLINFHQTVKFPFGIAPIPAQSAGTISVIGGSGFGISVDTKDPEDCWRAITVLTGPQAEQYLASTGRAFAARVAQQVYWYKNAVPGAKTVLDYALKHSIPYVTTSNWNEVSTLLNQYDVSVLNGQESAAQALKTVQEQAGTH